MIAGKSRRRAVIARMLIFLMIVVLMTLEEMLKFQILNILLVMIHLWMARTGKT